MTDIELLLLLIATIFGAVLSAVLGWTESGNAFDAKKFLPSIIRASIAAAVVSVGINYADIPITLMIYIGAFLTGLGIDAGGNRLSGTLRTKE